MDEREDEEPGTQPEPEQPPAAPEGEPADAPRPSALEAWAPGPPVSEPDDVGEVPAIEGHEPPPDETSPGDPAAAASPDGPDADTAPSPDPAVPSSEAEPQAVPTEAEAEEASVLPAPQVRAVLESLIFASPQPITAREIGRVLQGVPRDEWERQLEALRSDYSRDERGLQIVEVAGGYQITTRPEYHDWVRELLDPRTPTRLSIQALETLAVIAYKQPVTLPEIIDLRGVKSGGVVKTLLEKRLIRITGRKEVVGRPMLYGTTKQFLLHFGLKSLDELPKIEEFAEVLGEEVDVAGLKRAIESPLPVQVGLSDPDGEQMPLFEAAAAPPGEAAEAGAPASAAADTDETSDAGDAAGENVEEPGTADDADAADTAEEPPAGDDPREG